MPLSDEQIANRIFDKLDSFDEKLDKTCERVTTMETKLEGYFRQVEKDEQQKDKNYKLGFAIIGIIFSLYAVVREFVYG